MSLKQTISSTERQNVHPLESNDPVAFRYIETVALSWLEQNAIPPLPRHQDLPFEAFEKATGRSVLVALSHGWYYQTHPDPEGNKLELIQKEFAPKLRERYPNTHIVVFFDFLATPQWPRTKEEDKIFRIAMKHMNSIYVYCDVALFLEARLPQVDLSELMSRICLNRYEFGVFRASIQVKHIKQVEEEEEEKKSDDYEYPQVNDIVLAVDKKNVKSLEDLKAIMDNKVREVSFLRRPYGIPNTIPNGDRGWLLLERVTIAIKAAAARKEDFDEIVLSDSPSVRKEIYVMCDRLREAAKKSKNRHSKHILKEELAHFENLLEQKKFSFASDKAVVKTLMDKLITRFSENWESESKKQRSMSKRVHEILLRWGAFSPKYIHECGFLSQKTRSDDLAETWRYLVFVIIVCPALVAPLFAFDVSDEPSILSSNSWKVALWTGSLQHIEAVALNCAMSLSLANISPEFENLLISCGVSIPLHVLFIMMMYYMFGTLPPYTTLFDAVFYLTVLDRLFSLKIIPVRDEHTGHVKRWNLGTWMNLPSSTRFDPKTRYQFRRTILTTMILWFLFTSYPILSAVFNEQSVVVQAIMVPYVLFSTLYSHRITHSRPHPQYFFRASSDVRICRCIDDWKNVRIGQPHVYDLCWGHQP